MLTCYFFIVKQNANAGLFFISVFLLIYVLIHFVCVCVYVGVFLSKVLEIAHFSGITSL